MHKQTFAFSSFRVQNQIFSVPTRAGHIWGLRFFTVVIKVTSKPISLISGPGLMKKPTPCQNRLIENTKKDFSAFKNVKCKCPALNYVPRFNQLESSQPMKIIAITYTDVTTVLHLHIFCTYSILFIYLFRPQNVRPVAAWRKISTLRMNSRKI